MGNHLIELVLPWGFLIPLRCCRLAAAVRLPKEPYIIPKIAIYHPKET
jgi:hypothetical protein